MELFLSHATTDEALVAEVRERLGAIGIRVYTAEHDNRAGQNVHIKIEQAIRRSHVMVVLLTKHGDHSHYVHQEIGFARGEGKLIVPLVTKAVASAGTGMLEGIEYIIVDEADPSGALIALDQRVAQLARQRTVDDLVTAALLAAAVGLVILTMRD